MLHLFQPFGGGGGGGGGGIDLTVTSIYLWQGRPDDHGVGASQRAALRGRL